MLKLCFLKSGIYHVVRLNYHGFRTFMQSKFSLVSHSGWYFHLILCDLRGACLLSISKNKLFQTSTISFMSSNDVTISHGTLDKSVIKEFHLTV